MQNQSILISTLSLQGAKDSSEIENIITTHDDIYRSNSASSHFITLAAKEVHNYATALRDGFEQVRPFTPRRNPRMRSPTSRPT